MPTNLLEVQRARELREKQQFTQAKHIFKQLIKNDQTNPIYHHELAENERNQNL